MNSIGIDVGGTFTDIIQLDEEASSLRVEKVPTNPTDQSIGVMDAIGAVQVSLEAVDKLVHGTTVGINTLLERDQHHVGLITTEGFRDVLDMRRRDRPDNYGLQGQYNPLIPRDLRVTVKERVDADGNVIHPSSEEDIRVAADTLLQRNVESVAVAFLHSYANPSNEELAAKVLEDFWPNDNVTVSSELLSELKEFERSSTAAANAYVKPRIEYYLRNLEGNLGESGYTHELLVMQANGGVVTAPKTTPVNTIFSGPSAGAIGAAFLGRKTGISEVLAVDMGGTSFDATVVTDGTVERTTQKSVEFGVPVQLPMVDVHSIGAGGGSIAWLDTGNVLQVGPKSAGADPGPVCYGEGGTAPTITDAHAMLGRIDPGVFTEDPVVDSVHDVISTEIATPLGLSVPEAAQAIIDVANDDMGNLLRLRTIERGFDPREFALMAYGGAGPMHAVELARELSIHKVLIPPFPGVMSAFGLLVADSQFDFVDTLNERVSELDLDTVLDICQNQSEAGLSEMQAQEIEFSSIESSHFADVHYEGQAHMVRIQIHPEGLTKDGIVEEFEAAYEARYHHTIEGVPAKIRSIRTVTVGVNNKPDLTHMIGQEAADVETARKHDRDVHFEGDPHRTPVYDRFSLPYDEQITGPAILEQPDSTIVIPPDTTGLIQQNGVIELEVNRA